MKNAKKWIAALVIAGVTGIGWCSLDRAPEGDAADENPALFFNRSWVEKKPEKYTEQVHGLYAARYSPFGIFEHDSAYEFHAERFDYKRDGSKIQVSFPQSGRTEEFTYAVKACEAPPPFDLCLDLSKNPWGGPRRYYGFRYLDDETHHLGAMRARNEGFTKQP